MRVLKTLIVGILTLIPSWGDATVTDGNAWQILSSETKSAYLIGYVEAMASCSAFATSKLNGQPDTANSECSLLVGVDNNKAVALVTRVTPVQLRDALDQFYKDATMRLISVPRALGLIFMRLTGSSEKDLNEMAEFERALAGTRLEPTKER